MPQLTTQQAIESAQEAIQDIRKNVAAAQAASEQYREALEAIQNAQEKLWQWRWSDQESERIRMAFRHIDRFRQRINEAGFGGYTINLDRLLTDLWQSLP